MKNKKSYRVYRKMFFLVLFGFIFLAVLFFLLLFLILSWHSFKFGSISNRHLLIIACSVISLLIVTQAFTVYWSHKVTKPITQIAQTIEKVAEGNFDEHIDTSSFKDEFRMLGDSLNTMIDELNSIEVMRSDFVSNVSHEFKAPLSAIQGYVTLLSSPGIEEKQREKYFSLLSESTRQLSGLVENVLKLSRIESQSIVSKNVKFSLDEELRQAVLMFEQQWSAKNIELDLDLPETEYYGSKDLLKQMWINLIGNAVKFTDKGGKIGVKIFRNSDNRTCVQIKDSGEGMNEEVKNHIFEKFYQGDSSRRAEGNGLGLALVKTVADLTGSEIQVESSIGKGTAFTVTLGQTAQQE